MLKRLTVVLALAILCVALVGCTRSTPVAEKTATSGSTPEAETSATLSPERAAVLAALAVEVEKDLGQPVSVQPGWFKISDGWAFVDGQTLQPSGEPIDYSKTRYSEAVAQGAFDDSFSALLKLENGSWQVVVFRIGATDVPWVEWPQAYGAPSSVFPPL